MTPLRKPTPLREWDGPITSAEDIGALDRHTIETLGLPGAVLMERAAEACTSRIIRQLDNPSKVAVFVGPGNNGGDGSAIARLLFEFGHHPTIVLAADPERLKGDAKLNYKICERLGIPIVDCRDAEEVNAATANARVWVDALLGVGNEEAPRGRIGELLDSLDKHLAQNEAQPWILAVDFPTGLTTASGTVPGLVLKANETVTLGAPKPAHYLPGGIDACGDVFIGDIGVLSPPPEDFESPINSFAASSFRTHRNERSKDSYKSRSGHVLASAGSEAMPGAAILSTVSAYRAGAGLVSLSSEEAVRHMAIQKEPSTIGVPFEAASQAALDGDDAFFADYHCFLIGPGFGVTDRRKSYLDALLEMQDGRPAVIDADGLTLIAGSGGEHKATGPLILTPHPGELARLLDWSLADVLSDIPGATEACADQYDATIVTKAAGAWIHEAGQSIAVYGAEPYLATAGSGDVLAGILAAFACRYSPLKAASMAARLHVEAGRTLADERGSAFASAWDIASAITPALDRLAQEPE